VNLLTGKDNGKWKAIQRLLNPGAKVEGLGGSDKPRSYAKARNKKYGSKKPFRSGQRPARTAPAKHAA